VSRDSRLAESQYPDKLAHTELSPLQEFEYSCPRRVGGGLENGFVIRNRDS